MSNAIEQIISLKYEHAETWRDKSDWFWLLGLCEEVIELGLSMLGLHKGPTDWEITQIAAIAMNWLEKRQQVEQDKKK